MEKHQFNEIENVTHKVLPKNEIWEQDSKEIVCEEIGPEETDGEELGPEEMGCEEIGSEEMDCEKIRGAEIRRVDKKTAKDSQTIILKMDENSEDDSIDLTGVMGSMGRRWKLFRYLFLIAVCAGFLIAAVIMGIRGMFGGGSYASAVVVFAFEGIDEGLDPSGGLFDVNKMKSTLVISEALESLGWADKDIEAIRGNIKLEGVIPDTVKQQISVINTVAEDAAEYYTNIADLDYFPSRYTVTLQKCKGMSGDETRELLNAILLSYKQFFMDSYADTSVLGTAVSVLNVETYDYLQAADMIENEIATMQAYVDSKKEQASGFRANSTGLSFGDLSSSIDTVKQLDLNNFVSFVQSNNLTKDAGTQIDYYNYQIRQYNLEIKELQSQLSDVEKTIAGYEKDPVIVMSNQDSVAQTSQTNAYYDVLLAKKLDLNKEISVLNTDMKQAYEMADSLNSATGAATDEDYQYADALLKGMLETVQTWSELIQKTATDYYENELYAGAYRISIPAQYTAAGSMGELIKTMLICGGIGALLVMIAWSVLGTKDEITRMRKDEAQSCNFIDMD